MAEVVHSCGCNQAVLKYSLIIQQYVNCSGRCETLSGHPGGNRETPQAHSETTEKVYSFKLRLCKALC
jgi:hypothetical protein